MMDEERWKAVEQAAKGIAATLSHLYTREDLKLLRMTSRLVHIVGDDGDYVGTMLWRDEPETYTTVVTVYQSGKPATVTVTTCDGMIATQPISPAPTAVLLADLQSHYTAVQQYISQDAITKRYERRFATVQAED